MNLRSTENMSKKEKNHLDTLLEVEINLLKNELEILRQEIEKNSSSLHNQMDKQASLVEWLLKEVAQKLVERNMAFPVIRHTIDLLEEELRGIFYGSGRGE